MNSKRRAAEVCVLVLCALLSGCQRETDRTWKPVTGLVRPPPGMKLRVDVQPGAFPDTFSWPLAGGLQVAVLSEPGVDATALAQMELHSGNFSASVSAAPVGEGDVDGDGLTDRIFALSLETPEAAGVFTQETTRVWVTAQALDGTPVWGLGFVQPSGAPHVALPPPSGPHPVGTRALYAEDASRWDFQADRTRELMLRLWFPAAPAPAREPAPYYLADLEGQANAEGQDLHWNFWDVVSTNAVENASPSDALAQWPVLVLSPGWDSSLAWQTALAEELASWGFVVIGIEHPFDSGAVVFPGGRLVEPPPEPRSPEVTASEWSEDQRFVVRFAEELARSDPSLQGRLLLGALGLVGHSLGGAAAVNTCLVESLCGFAANLNGRLVGEGTQAPFTRPTLLVNGGNTFPQAEQDGPLRRATGPVIELAIDGALHNDFSDLGYWYPLVPGATADSSAKAELSARAPSRTRDIVSAYSRAMASEYLQGTHRALLDGDSQDFPEVKLRSRNR